MYKKSGLRRSTRIFLAGSIAILGDGPAVHATGLLPGGTPYVSMGTGVLNATGMSGTMDITGLLRSLMPSPSPGSGMRAWMAMPVSMGILP